LYGEYYDNSDTDSIWFDDPFPYSSGDCDVYGLPFHKDQDKNTRVHGTFISIKGNFPGISFWNGVMKCEHRKMIKIEQMRVGGQNFNINDYTEQDCIDTVGMTLKSKGTLKFCQLEDFIYSDGSQFFDSMMPQKSGVWPIIIHNNYNGISEIKGKEQRLKDWNLWRLDDHGQCSGFAEAISKLGTNITLPLIKRRDYRLKIRILTQFKADSFHRLLNSLKDAIYTDDDPIDLEISIDVVRSELSSYSIARTAILKEAHSLIWTKGRYNIIDHTTPQGLYGQWLKGWTPQNDSEILLVLEDDIRLSKHWYSWLKFSLEKYYADPENYDPHIFGISLQRQHAVIGETVYRFYGSLDLQKLLGDSHMWKYQALGTWGAVFFPEPWKDFQLWYENQVALKKEPCVPSFVSNKWWRRTPNSVWSVWHLAWAFQKGMYSLYFHFPHSQKGLVSNERLIGENFKEDHGQLNNNLIDISPTEYNDNGSYKFENIRDLPFYDFHFRRQYGNPDVLAERVNIFSKFPQKLMCADISQLKTELKLVKGYYFSKHKNCPLDNPNCNESTLTLNSTSSMSGKFGDNMASTLDTAHNGQHEEGDDDNDDDNDEIRMSNQKELDEFYALGFGNVGSEAQIPKVEPSKETLTDAKPTTENNQNSVDTVSKNDVHMVDDVTKMKGIINDSNVTSEKRISSYQIFTATNSGKIDQDGISTDEKSDNDGKDKRESNSQEISTANRNDSFKAIDQLTEQVINKSTLRDQESISESIKNGFTDTHVIESTEKKKEEINDVSIPVDKNNTLMEDYKIENLKRMEITGNPSGGSEGIKDNQNMSPSSSPSMAENTSKDHLLIEENINGIKDDKEDNDEKTGNRDKEDGDDKSEKDDKNDKGDMGLENRDLMDVFKSGHDLL